MPVYFNLRCIFVHIPKTAGQSIDKMLTASNDALSNDGEYEFTHLLANQYNFRFEDFFKFSIVRHPLDRLVSEYCFSKKYRPYLLNSENISFSEFVEAISKMNIDKLPHIIGNHLYSQTKFLMQENKLLVDYLGRFESLHESIQEVQNRIKKPLQSLEHINKSDRIFLCDDKTKDLVKQMYYEDYVNFGYI